MDLIDRAELLKDYTQTFVVGHGMKAAETFRGVVKQAQKVDAVPMSVIEDIKAEIQKTIKKGMIDAQYGLEIALLIIDEKVKER